MRNEIEIAELKGRLEAIAVAGMIASRTRNLTLCVTFGREANKLIAELKELGENDPVFDSLENEFRQLEADVARDHPELLPQ